MGALYKISCVYAVAYLCNVNYLSRIRSVNTFGFGETAWMLLFESEYCYGSVVFSFSFHNNNNNNNDNSLYTHSLAAAKIPSRLEPSGLFSSDRKRPDGVSLVPWSQGRYLAWDATCVDTFCPSNLPHSVDAPG